MKVILTLWYKAIRNKKTVLVILAFLLFLCLRKVCLSDEIQDEFLVNAFQIQYLFSDYQEKDDEHAFFFLFSHSLAPKFAFQYQYKHNPIDSHTFGLIHNYQLDTFLLINYGFNTSEGGSNTSYYSLGAIHSFSSDTTLQLNYQYTDLLDSDTSTIFIRLNQVLLPVTLGQLKYYLFIDEQSNKSHHLELRINQHLFTETALHGYYIYSIDSAGYYIKTLMLNFYHYLSFSLLLKVGYRYQMDSYRLRSDSPCVQLGYEVSQYILTYIQYKYYIESSGLTSNNFGIGIRQEF